MSAVGSGTSLAWSDYLVPYRDVPAEIEYVERPPTPESKAPPQVAAVEPGADGVEGKEVGTSEEENVAEANCSKPNPDVEADVGSDANIGGVDSGGDGGSWVISCKSPPMVFPPLPDEVRGMILDTTTLECSACGPMMRVRE